LIPLWEKYGDPEVATWDMDKHSKPVAAANSTGHYTTSQKFRVERKLLSLPTASQSSPKPDGAVRFSWQRPEAILTRCFSSELHPRI
jgi:hypothetical protein